MTDICPEHSGLCVKIKSVEKSIDVAKVELDRRLEAMNEFRAQLDKQSREFVTRTEVELRFDRIDEKIRNLEKTDAENQGKSLWREHLITAIIGALILIGIWMITK